MAYNPGSHVIQVFVNDAATTLASAITSTGLLAVTVDASSFPVLTNEEFVLVALEYNGNIEIIKVIGKSGNNLVIDDSGRGWEGTTALAFPISTRVEGRLTAGSLNTIISNAAIATTTEITTRQVQDDNLLNAINAELVARVLADSNELARATAAEDLKAPLNSPALTGNGTITTTPASATSNTTLANTAFVHSVTDPIVTNLTSEISRATTAEAGKAPLGGSGTSGTWPISVSGNAASATTVTGTIGSGVTATTQTATDNSTKVATTAFVQGRAGVPTVIVDTDVPVAIEQVYAFSGTRPILLSLTYLGGCNANAPINIIFSWGLGSLTTSRTMFNGAVDYQVAFTATITTVLLPSVAGSLHVKMTQLNTLGTYGAPTSLRLLAVQM
jgi:hypothetical protein